MTLVLAVFSDITRANNLTYSLRISASNLSELAMTRKTDQVLSRNKILTGQQYFITIRSFTTVLSTKGNCGGVNYYCQET